MNEFEKIHDFNNLYRAFKQARKGKRYKHTANKFEANVLEALLLLSRQIKSMTYTLSPYNTFMVYEPKTRLVMSNSYKDKVVQHALCDNVLEPAFIRSFIKDNYASQTGKGTHYGLDRLAGFMRSFYRSHGVDGWALKCDITKYFYTIRHDLLKSLIRKQVNDPGVLWLVDMIIDSTDDGVGIPIGNQSSQLFALLYLNGMDHHIKEKQGIKYYGRYMDDFYLIHKERDYINRCKNEIQAHVESLGLTLNDKTCISPLKNGIDFLGFHTYLTDTGKVIRKIRRKSKNNARRRMKKMKALVDNDELLEETAVASYQAWKGHAAHGNCYNLIRGMDQLYNTLYEKGDKNYAKST